MEEEAEVSNIALEQLIQFAPKVKEDPEYLFPEDGKILVLKEEGEDNHKRWVENWIDVDKLVSPAFTDISVLSKNIQLVKSLKLNHSISWAADMFFIPEPVIGKKGEPPFSR